MEATIDTLSVALRNRVKQARTEAGLSQEQAAKLTGYTVSAYAKKELGYRSITVQDIEIFCNIFKKNALFFFPNSSRYP